MPKIIVLGGNGFVGKSVCKALTEGGLAHHVVSRSTGIDLRETAPFQSMLAEIRPDYIINCAAQVGSLNYVTELAAEIVTNNSRMILAMYEAVSKSVPGAIIINPIANCAYPGKADSYIEDQWQGGAAHRSVLPYAAAKRLLWAVGECYAMQHGIQSINLLVPNMYGPYDSTDPNKAHALNALVSKFVKARKLNQKTIEIWGTGVAIREWLYAKDFGRIIVHILTHPKMVGLTEPLNIAQNFGLSVRELVDIINSNFDSEFDIKYDPSKPDGALKKVMDDRKFQKVFPGFVFTPQSEGIRNTINYYESVYPY